MDLAYDVTTIETAQDAQLRILPVSLDALLDHDGAFRSLVGRASQWSALEHAHLLKEPFCRACGVTKELQVHHKIPYSWDPSKELDPLNLITLCRVDHLLAGHLRLWASFNEKCEEWCDMIRKAIVLRPIRAVA